MNSFLSVQLCLQWYFCQVGHFLRFHCKTAQPVWSHLFKSRYCSAPREHLQCNTATTRLNASLSLYKGICMTNKGCSGAFALYLAPHKCFSDIIVVFIHSSNWLLLGCENDYFVFIPIWYLEIYKYKYHVFNRSEVPDAHQFFSQLLWKWLE